MKKGLSLLLALLFIVGTFACCAKAPVSSDNEKDPPKNPTIREDDWILGEDSKIPAATPAKDPAAGVKVSYKCEPADGGTIDGKGTQYIVPGGYTETVTAIPLYGYEFVCWSDGSTARTRPTDKVTEDTVLTATFAPGEVPFKITVPDVHIETMSGGPVKTKDYVNATISITGADKDKHNITKVATRIKGRGNSSWSSSYIGKELGDVRWSSTRKEFHISCPPAPG